MHGAARVRLLDGAVDGRRDAAGEGAEVAGQELVGLVDDDHLDVSKEVRQGPVAALVRAEVAQRAEPGARAALLLLEVTAEGHGVAGVLLVGGTGLGRLGCLAHELRVGHQQLLHELLWRRDDQVRRRVRAHVPVGEAHRPRQRA